MVMNQKKDVAWKIPRMMFGGGKRFIWVDIKVKDMKSYVCEKLWNFCEVLVRFLVKTFKYRENLRKHLFNNFFTQLPVQCIAPQKIRILFLARQSLSNGRFFSHCLSAFKAEYELQNLEHRKKLARILKFLWVIREMKASQFGQLNSSDSSDFPTQHCASRV